MGQEIQKIWSLYRITNKINGKVYIGQAEDYKHRWADHRRAYKLNKPTQAIHYALIKYGLDNFEFEVIASCKTQDDTNWTETELVAQYDSFIANGHGYNATLGGMNAPKSEEWKKKLSDWHASLSSEEKEARSIALKEATLNQIATKGHPAQGTKRTPEQLQTLSKARQDHPVDYTPEKRQRMSEAHLGIKDTEETKKKKSEKATAAWEKRNAISMASGEIKCNAPGCDVQGKHTYYIINNIRYCGKHAQRLKRKGSLD